MPSLAKIAQEITRCRECKKGKFGLAVPGDGKVPAKIMLIGEAPGRNEAEVGRPFVGRGGKLLTKLLDSIGLKRKNVFITSPVKYYPGVVRRSPPRRGRKTPRFPSPLARFASFAAKVEGRTPTDKEIRHGAVHLVKQIAAIKPRVIVLMGKVAHKALIGDVQVTRVHGKTLAKDKIIYFSTFHPAAALRFPRITRLMQRDFKKLKKVIRRA